MLKNTHLDVKNVCVKANHSLSFVIVVTFHDLTVCDFFLWGDMKQKIWDTTSKYARLQNLADPNPLKLGFHYGIA